MPLLITSAPVLLAGLLILFTSLSGRSAAVDFTFQLAGYDSVGIMDESRARHCHVLKYVLDGTPGSSDLIQLPYIDTNRFELMKQYLIDPRHLRLEPHSTAELVMFQGAANWLKCEALLSVTTRALAAKSIAALELLQDFSRTDVVAYLTGESTGDVAHFNEQALEYVGDHVMAKVYFDSCCAPDEDGVAKCDEREIWGHLWSAWFHRPNWRHTKQLDLSGNQYIQSIARRSFSGMPQLTHLSMLLGQNTIRMIEDHAFHGLQKLQSLELTGTEVSSINANTFAGLPSLQYLQLYSNRITTLKRGAFRDMTSLTMLILDGNQIESFDKNVFRGLSRLETLSVKENQIAAIGPGMFAGLISLIMLDLTDNQIESIDADAFDGLPHLDRLFLNNNRIASIAPGAFTRTKYLDMLHLTGNPICGTTLHTSRGGLPDHITFLYC
ncbi:unnamed protein product (mitochondrion) [Plasmodiophora brassicae]|uniref:Leucine-rich repeat-containing N-terminal plant-type domain-containing protein n=1 Tax=Plasmodiophora brassicae TaxID=37360 RepID=A0A3P3YM19_PLABS|nr:unnamed protein product [Plasmodiophora brassicae]